MLSIIFTEYADKNIRKEILTNFKFDKNLNEYKFLGKGVNSSVYQISKNVCIKVLHQFKVDKNITYRKELAVLSKLRETEIVPIVYGYNNRKTLIFVEYIQGSSLVDYMKRNGVKKDILYGIADRLAEIYLMGIYPHDIQTENIKVFNKKFILIDVSEFSFMKNFQHNGKSMDIGYLFYLMDIYSEELMNKQQFIQLEEDIYKYLLKKYNIRIAMYSKYMKRN